MQTQRFATSATMAATSPLAGSLDAALGLPASPVYLLTAAEATARVEAAWSGRDRSQRLHRLLLESAEARALWDLANNTTTGKLGYNDHGVLHAQITGANGVQLLDLLVEGGSTPDVVRSGIGSIDDATVVVLAAGMLHDVGNALHREGQAGNGVIMADPLLRRLLPRIYPEPRQAHLIRISVLAAINAHDIDPPPLTLEAAVVAVADALDVTAGRGEVAFRRGKVDIHAISALAIDRVTISAGTDRPVQVDVDMHSDAGLFQLEQTLLRKLLATELRDRVSVRACVNRGEQAAEPRVIDCLALVDGHLAGTPRSPAPRTT